MDRQEIISELKRIPDKDRVLIYRHDWDADKRIEITVKDILDAIESENACPGYIGGKKRFGVWDRLFRDSIEEYYKSFVEVNRIGDTEWI